MKKSKLCLLLLSSLALVAGGAAAGTSLNININGLASIVRADATVISSEFAYGTEAILGEWTTASGSPTGFGNASTNATVNGETVSSVKSLNLKGCTINYAIPSSFDNVKKVTINLWAVKTGNKAGTVVFSAFDENSENIDSTDALSLTSLTLNGNYSSNKSSIEVDDYKIAQSLESGKPIKNLQIAFAGGSNVVVSKIEISYENSSVVATKLDCPSASIVDNTITVVRDENSTCGYELHLYDLSNDSEYGDCVKIEQPSSGNASYTYEDIPQNIKFGVKVKSLGDNNEHSPSELSEYISDENGIVSITSTSYKSVTVSHAYNELPNQTGTLFVYYDIGGTVNSLNSSSSNITIMDDDKSVYMVAYSVSNYDDYPNLSVGDDITIRAYKKDGKLYGGSIVSSSINYCGRFESLLTKTQLSVSYGYEEKDVDSQWKLVSSVSDLVVGGTYTFGSSVSGSTQIMSNVANENNRKTVLANVATNGTLVASDSDTILRLTLGGSDGSWTFCTTNYAGTNGYLNATNTTKKNYLTVVSTDDSYNKFSISFEDRAAVVQCVGKNLRNVLEYNSSDKIFSCYTSGQSNVYLYKLEDEGKEISYPIKKTDSGKNDISLSFGLYFDAALKQSLDNIGATEYGIAYKKDDDEYTYKKLSGAYVVQGGSSSSVNETLEAAVENKHYYQFRYSLFGIPESDFGVVVTAAAYVKVGTVYHMTEISEYSVNSIAKYYVDNLSDDANVKSHLDMLNWLSTYQG